jgi:hypothetical protein
MTRVRDAAVCSQESGVDETEESSAPRVRSVSSSPEPAPPQGACASEPADAESVADGCAVEAFRRGITLVRQRSRYFGPAKETCLALAEAALAAATLTGPHGGCSCRPEERCPVCHLREVFDGARAAVSTARFAVVAAADRQRLATGVDCACSGSDR